ncbi:carboxylesterase/lipase family protein [Prolixibacter denitrificans]|uniref:Carboxylic ester hydrolase n=1 Tax=Prolixibacter denitrificans TaxID=1541063 RepID=A0A2P8CJX3_9BACT|nr:carboxylesterase family protein [Prolixibacter denitrificans]PSK85245.1 para-nitrobenzyl esterase [Prolixibacter denitrificans]GET19867.1 carboxylic ester hydrolase [Prolixibacter denitrificans]
MKYLTRRDFFRRTAFGILPALALPHLAHSSLSFSSTDVEVETSYGKLRGLRTEGVNIYKGVPYAGSVSGERRFLKPAALKPWTGVREATRLGPPSIQPPNQTYGINEPDPAEDCLTLNIWTPANDDKKRPVMVYNHGGGFRTGSAGSVAQDGSNLARMYDVVVVATNHRLGLLGYLYLDEIAGDEYAGSGNRGIQDIAIALKWVNENISAFGGDPDNVMIFGESGGGAKTSCLYAMPEAAPYFHKASIESGPGVMMKTADVAAETTELLLKRLGIARTDWRKLLKLPPSVLLDAQEQLQKMGDLSQIAGFHGIGAAGKGGFGPVVDGVVLSTHPFDPIAPSLSKEKPLQVGWNEDEFIFFAMVSGDTEAFQLTQEKLYQRIESILGDKAQLVVDTYREAYPKATPTQLFIAIRSILIMGLGSITIAERKTKQGGAPAYLYNFGYKSDLKVPGTDYEFGSMHALDIPFKFHNIDNVLDKSGHRSSSMAGNRPERFAASDNMCQLWTSFARTSVPSAKGQPTWPAYNLDNRPTMRIDSSCEVIYDRYATELSMWRKALS